jgi:uncharacterized protein
MKLSVNRRHLVTAAVCALVFAAGALLSDAALAARRKPKRLLVVTLTKGFRHDSIPTGEAVLKQIGDETKLWTTDYARTDEEVTRAFTAAGLRPYSAVVFVNTTGELPITEQGKADFLAWLRSGRGFVGMHAATDTFYQWPEYGKMIGGYFNGHPWHEEVTCKVETFNHPSTRSLFMVARDRPSSFNITDEIYQFKDWSRDGKTVLLSIDNASIDVSKGAREDKDYAVSWARMEGKGRVFYTSLGHRQEVWRDPTYQRHITGGIAWALGLARR